MTDRYENIRRALAMGPTPGPWRLSRRDDWHGPIVQRGKQGGFVVHGLSPAAEDADAALIAACDPDTIRELMAERDALAEGLSDTEKDVAVAQAVEFAEYVERQAKGAMRDTAKRFLSLPYSQEVAGRMKDALRYRWLRTKLMAANFHPEDPNGLDLGEGVALIFLLPSASRVTPDLDWTIDQARGKEDSNG